ncbi:lytic transglycosylase domain-containing protein, partial [Mailhella massiliensis]
WTLALFLVPSGLQAGVILSEEVSVTETSLLERKHTQEFLIDSMDVASLSPSARLLALPRPMVTPELAEAMNEGKIYTAPEEWRRIIAKAAKAYDLPESLIAAVIRTESAFQAHAVSPKGARGAMQIMPETQKELGLEDPYDAEANVMAGSAYLRRQLDRFGSLDLALAAYNAGPANVVKYGGVPPFPETQAYLRQVTAHRLAETSTSKQRENSHE